MQYSQSQKPLWLLIWKKGLQILIVKWPSSWIYKVNSLKIYLSAQYWITQKIMMHLRFDSKENTKFLEIPETFARCNLLSFLKLPKNILIFSDKKCHSWTKLGPSLLFKNRSLIPTLSYLVFNFQAPLHFLVSGLTGNEAPKYHENGCACGEAGLAEEMEIWAKSRVSQILKRSVAWFPDQ